MIPGRSKCLVAVLLLIWIVFHALSTSAAEKKSDVNVKELEKRVENILKKDNVTMRGYVDDIFLLADIYASEGKEQQAIKLYEEALKVDSWRFDYQLKLAHLMHKHGYAEQAIEKARIVCEQAQDTAIINQAREFLSSLGAACTSASTGEVKTITEDVEIVMVPIGEPDEQLLNDLKNELEAKVGITYSIQNGRLRLGDIDRRSDKRYIDALAERLESALPWLQMQEVLWKYDLNREDLKIFEGKVRFIEGVFDASGMPQEKVQEFRRTLQQLKGQGQYDADRLLTNIRKRYPAALRPEIKGYLGITKEDIYGEDFNFLFGWAGKGHGVMSYHRFTAEFNNEPPDRERLLNRTIRQAMSSSLTILGIPRCTTPTCARAYPHNLSEHDRKGTELCSWCEGRLEAYIRRNLRTAAH